MNKREVGTHWEREAADFLQNSGYEILTTNYRCRFGEIDIIAKEQESLVFVEVKYRKNNSFGSPFEAVDERKQRVIRKTAQHYMLSGQYKMASECCRFDVVGITGNEIELLKNAF